MARDPSPEQLAAIVQAFQPINAAYSILKAAVENGNFGLAVVASLETARYIELVAAGAAKFGGDPRVEGGRAVEEYLQAMRDHGVDI